MADARIPLPTAYSDRMRELLGEEDFSEYQRAMEEPAIRSLRVNTLKISVAEFLRDNPWGITEKDGVPWCGEGFYLKDPSLPYGKSAFHHAGLVYMQEASAMAPAVALSAKPGEKVLDLCASPGGKSTLIAAAMQNTGLLVLNEPVFPRAKILSENVERLGIANALVLSHTPEELAEHFAGSFDRILVDAPCSGEGMFRKNPEAAGEWSTENVAMCAERQRGILKEACQMLRPGGILVYSTCTFNREEDEDMTAYLTETFADLKVLEERKILPFRDPGEGQYYAVFSGPGNDSPRHPVSTRHGSAAPSEYTAFRDAFLSKDAPDLLYKGNFIRIGDGLYVHPEYVPPLDGLKVLRCGLKLGMIEKGRFEPSHALALYLRKEEVRSSCELSDDEAVRYLRGETLRIDGLPENTGRGAAMKAGWLLLTYRGKSIGLGKYNNGMIKNHYPKGLRNQG